MAVRALHAGHEAADFFLHPLAVGLAEAALKVLHDALEGIIVHTAAELIRAVHLNFFAIGSVQQRIDSFGAHLFDGRIQRKAVLFAKAKVIHFGYRPLGIVPAAGLDGTLTDGKVPVGQDAFLVHPHKGAKAGTLFAGSQRVIEGEEPRRQVADGNAMLRAGKVLAEGHTIAADHVHFGDAAGKRQRGFQRICQTAPDALAHGKAVHHDLHRMLDVLFQLDLFVKIIQVAVDLHTSIATAAGSIQLFLLGAFALAHHRSQHLKLRTFVQFEHRVHHFVHGLLADHPPAHRAVGHAHAGVQKSQIIVDLRHGAHGGTRVVAGGFLVDGNCR